MYDNMDLVLAYMRASPKYSDLDIRYALLSDYFEGWVRCAAGGWDALLTHGWRASLLASDRAARPQSVVASARCGRLFPVRLAP